MQWAYLFIILSKSSRVKTASNYKAYYVHWTIGYVAGQSEMPMLELLLTSQLASMHSAQGPAQLNKWAASQWIFPTLGRLKASGPQSGFFNKNWPLFICYLAGNAALLGDKGLLLDKL